MNEKGGNLMKRKIRINIAWALWILLTDCGDKIWRQYEKDFIDIIMEEDDLMFFKERSQDVIPF